MISNFKLGLYIVSAVDDFKNLNLTLHADCSKSLSLCKSSQAVREGLLLSFNSISKRTMVLIDEQKKCVFFSSQ